MKIVPLACSPLAPGVSFRGSPLCSGFAWGCDSLSQAPPRNALACTLRLLLLPRVKSLVSGCVRGGASLAVRSQAEPGTEEGHDVGAVDTTTRAGRNTRSCIR